MSNKMENLYVSQTGSNFCWRCLLTQQSFIFYSCNSVFLNSTIAFTDILRSCSHNTLEQICFIFITEIFTDFATNRYIAKHYYHISKHIIYYYSTHSIGIIYIFLIVGTSGRGINTLFCLQCFYKILTI